MDVPKIEIKKILYATDLSESGRYAFSYAASLSSLYGAELTAFHVVDEGPELDRSLAGYMDEALWEEIKKRDLQEARDILVSRKRDDAAVRQCVGDYCDAIQNGSAEPYVTYTVLVKAGNPVQLILEEAEKGDYDIIVIGRHGHSMLKDSMMGNTVRRVLRRAAIPVLIVPLPE